jgi:hypothetical protein
MEQPPCPEWAPKGHPTKRMVTGWNLREPANGYAKSSRHEIHADRNIRIANQPVPDGYWGLRLIPIQHPPFAFGRILS